MDSYEYCIMHVAFPDEPHRIVRSLEECKDWMEWAASRGVQPDVFHIGVRKIGPWARMVGVESECPGCRACGSDCSDWQGQHFWIPGEETCDFCESKRA